MMPLLVRWAGNLLPLTHFLVICRGIMTKGVGLYFFREQVWILLFYVVVVFVLGSFSFKERLE